jgi:hypothetical protein
LLIFTYASCQFRRKASHVGAVVLVPDFAVRGVNGSHDCHR